MTVCLAVGAIGGLAHHPLQAATEPGASTLGVVAGISKGIFGFVAKPIGATVELVAKTGQGLLQGAGWIPNYQVRHDVEYCGLLATMQNIVRSPG